MRVPPDPRHASEHHLGETILRTAEYAFKLPEPSHSRWHRAGVTPRAERIFEVVSGIVLSLFVLGWSWSIAAGRSDRDAGGAVTPVTASITAALTDPAATSTAYLTDALVRAVTPLRGESGRLRVALRQPGDTLLADTLPAGAAVRFESGVYAQLNDSVVAPRQPGVWGVAIQVGQAIKPVADFSLITLRPFSDKRRGRIGLYFIGSWPGERGRAGARGAQYANPEGFIEVTPENQETRVSEHFRLRDFLTKGQPNVWPKYLVLDLTLVDKLELVLEDLTERGLDVRGVTVMSGFRTPSYNATGGNTAGRAELSRHMYGDAADIFIDADGNGVMDDLNGDRRVTIADARVLLAAVERVEREHPALVGGAGVYAAGPGHGPFIHIDTRGYRARWLGSGDN
ncbi:MAG TPA: hypothetical protein VFZ11_10450 [Gemmatimonadaceae bacterium]